MTGLHDGTCSVTTEIANPALMVAHVDRLCDALRLADSPAAIFDAVGQATLEVLGPGLLTINAWHADTATIVRLWSSDPSSYPVGGTKQKGDTPWTRQLLQRGEVFVGEGDEALAAVFDDIAVIRRLGLRGIVNVPLCQGGRVIGTFNYLADIEAWSGAEITALRLLGQLALPAVAALATTA
ncbi:GAF domain-containing protein [Cupriavidus sp. H19C3]